MRGPEERAAGLNPELATWSVPQGGRCEPGTLDSAQRETKG